LATSSSPTRPASAPWTAWTSGSRWASPWGSSGRTGAASRPWCGTSTASSARTPVDVGDRHVAQISREVGLAFQDPDRQIFAGRVRTEVAFGPRNLGVRGPALDGAVADALAAVGLADAADANPYDLGYSRRKLLAIASVLAMRTPIVILDEPTTGQDLRGAARVQAIVRGLVAEGRTVLAVSHDMRFVAETFRRVVVMREGRIVLDGTPEQVFAEAAWPVLASTHLEPPLPARVGARLGLGSTPTEAALVEALVTARG
jgi:energy-coupling factor transport system ATP-binding protein